MINTNCENCIFSQISESDCVFDIPNIVKNSKKIYKKNNHNYIENYICRYTLSKEVYSQLMADGHTTDQILQHMISELTIKYYLVVNLDNTVESLKGLCDTINQLKIKPKFISFINKNLVSGNEMSEIIQKHLSKDISWKLHNFLIDMNLQQCMTICMDTNFNKTSSNVFLVYDQALNGNDIELLNNRILFLHMAIIIEQRPCYAIVNNFSDLDGLAMGFNVYKILINNRCRDILLAIQKENEETPDFKYIYYDKHTD